MDYYQTLGVDKSATSEDIKKAYRKLASKHHPDRGGDTATFQKIQSAYDVLSDPTKRQEYDNPSMRMGGGGFQGFRQGPGHFTFDMGGGHVNMEDILSQFFGHTQRQNNRPQQQIFRTTVDITLQQAYLGGEQIMQLQTPTTTQSVKIQIPRGVSEGSQIRIEKVLDNATLLVGFRIHKDLKFERRGDDLLCNQQISVLDLITGATFKFTTISGKELEVNVKAGTQPYMQLKIPGQGMPILNTNGYGDQILLLKPFIPDNIDQSIIDSIRLSQQKGSTT